MIEPIFCGQTFFSILVLLSFWKIFFLISINLKISREKIYFRRRKNGTKVQWKKTITDTQVHDFSQGHGGWPETIHIGLVQVH